MPIKDPVKRAEYNKKYYKTNIVTIREQQAEYNEINKDKIREQQRTARLEEPERFKVYAENTKENRDVEADRERDRLRWPGRKEQSLNQKRAKHMLDQRPRLLRSARERALERGTPFTITEEDIVVPENCPVFGEPLIPGIGQAHDFSPTLDEIIPGMGYIPGNIQVLSRLANTAKNKMTPAQMIMFADWVYSNLDTDGMG